MHLVESVACSCGLHFRRIVGPALGEVDGGRRSRRLGLGEVARNHLERFGERIV
jgi:hypothetical protein